MGKPRTSQRAVKPKQAGDSAVVKNSPAFSGGERQSQVTLKMRESLHRELARKAFDSGMTMRGFIMRALRRAGLDVTDADLVDRRRRED